MLKFRRPSTTGSINTDPKAEKMPPRVCWCHACRTSCRKHPDQLVQAARRAMKEVPRLSSQPAQLPIARATFPPDELTPAIRKLARRAERRAAKKAHEAKKRREGKLVRRPPPKKGLLNPLRERAVDPLDVMDEFRAHIREEIPLKNTHLELWKVEKKNGVKFSSDEEIYNVKRWRKRWGHLERQRRAIVLNSPFNLTQKPVDVGPYPTRPTPRTPNGTLSSILWAQPDNQKVTK